MSGYHPPEPDVTKLSWLQCTVQLGSRCDCADTTMTHRAGFLEQTPKQSNQAPNYISKIKFEKKNQSNPDVNVITLNSKNQLKNGCNHLRANGRWISKRTSTQIMQCASTITASVTRPTDRHTMLAKTQRGHCPLVKLTSSSRSRIITTS